MTSKILMTLAVFYHVLATVATIAGAFQLLGISLGKNSFNPFWKQAVSLGELHLWISGILIVGLGLYMQGTEYLMNPKLWAKVSLVAVWTANSLLLKSRIRKTGLTKCVMFGISFGSLLYGTFLGVAKPLAKGVAPYEALLAGYFITLTLTVVSLHMKSRGIPGNSPRLGV